MQTRRRSKDNQDVPPLKGHIHFDDIHFRYTDNEPILTGFGLLIQPGETLALVGHTGAGKSSIAKLIARFYEYQQGRLLMDGHDIRTLDLAQYRKQLGIVSQVPFLFSGTVADNIRYAAPNATEAEMLEMARKIGDGEWLETLPNGIQTEGGKGRALIHGAASTGGMMRVPADLHLHLDEATPALTLHRMADPAALN